MGCVFKCTAESISFMCVVISLYRVDSKRIDMVRFMRIKSLGNSVKTKIEAVEMAAKGKNKENINTFLKITLHVFGEKF